MVGLSTINRINWPAAAGLLGAAVYLKIPQAISAVVTGKYTLDQVLEDYEKGEVSKKLPLGIGLAVGSTFLFGSPVKRPRKMKIKRRK